MASTFRRGSDVISEVVDREPPKRQRFTPHIRWDGGEEKFVQFLMPMEEIPTVLMHRFVIVGRWEDSGKEKYETFISRRDPALDGPQGYDELMDRFGLNPTERSMVLAAEMNPVYSTAGTRKKIEGFELAYREYEDAESETQQVPVFGLVEESPRTFFTHLAANADVQPIEETVWKVKRTGKSTDTTYTFIATNIPAVDVSQELEDFEFDFDAYLEELADEQRMKDIIGPLDDDWKVTRYPKEKKKQSSQTGSTRTRREVVEEVDDSEAVSEETPSESKRRRFQDLADQVKARA